MTCAGCGGSGDLTREKAAAILSGMNFGVKTHRISADKFDPPGGYDNPQKYIDELPPRQKGRWVFIDIELVHPEHCKANDLFVAYPAASNEQLGVIVYRDGRVTNRWDDGTAGVPDRLGD